MFILEAAKLTNRCMIINEQTNEVVVQNRIKDWKGITFPGGKIEIGEAIIPSTIREIKEETGLTISNLLFCGLKNWYDFKKQERYIVFLFKTTKYQGTLLKDTPEGKVSWMPLAELKNQDLSSDFMEMLDIFLGKKAEFFYEDTQADDEKARWVKRFY
ncbi:MAG: 8-oxo-dGTP diphosphatase [Bacilli bacterium]